MASRKNNTSSKEPGISKKRRQPAPFRWGVVDSNYSWPVETSETGNMPIKLSGVTYQSVGEYVVDAWSSFDLTFPAFTPRDPEYAQRVIEYHSKGKEKWQTQEENILIIPI